MYLDPGFGGMLVQVIVVIAAVGGGVLFSLRRKIKNLFNKDKGPAAKMDDASLNQTANDATDMLDDAVDMLDDEEK